MLLEQRNILTTFQGAKLLHPRIGSIGTNITRRPATRRIKVCRPATQNNPSLGVGATVISLLEKARFRSETPAVLAFGQLFDRNNLFSLLITSSRLASTDPTAKFIDSVSNVSIVLL